MKDPRRSIPGVDALLAAKSFGPLLETAGRERVIRELRRVQAAVRSALGEGGGGSPESTGVGRPPAPGDDPIARVPLSPEAIGDPAWYAARVADALQRAERPSLRRVINATGVVLHTNLGRAPLADAAVGAMVAVAGYGSLEYDLAEGRRGSRYEHCVDLLQELTGAEDALVVNNNAAAVVLVLNTLARGRSAVVSRGELVEIGGSFRVPEIMSRSGARLREVGSTNRTHPDDYATALSDAALILKVHRSNFRVEGFTAEVGVEVLAGLAREHQVPLVHDLGSGALLDMTRLGLPPEPTARNALDRGADVVTMSGDKLLGGPQAGIVLGTTELVGAMRMNPLCRALRPDKLTLAALEATLALYRDPHRAMTEIPVLRMLGSDAAGLRARAEGLAARLAEAGVPAITEACTGAVGGGAYPGVELPGFAVTLATPDPEGLARALRAADPPVVGRIHDDRVWLHPRTVQPLEEDALVTAVIRAVGESRGG